MKSVTNAARQKNEKIKVDELKAEKLELKRKLAEKFGDKFKAIKRKNDTVVVSKEALKKAESADESSLNEIKSNNPNAEETKEKLRGLLVSGSFSFNEKEKAALEEILG